MHMKMPSERKQRVTSLEMCKIAAKSWHFINFFSTLKAWKEPIASDESVLDATKVFDDYQ